jgi:beta-glucosidase
MPHHRLGIVARVPSSFALQGVPRLGIPAFNYWTEAQHGVGVSQGVTTPQPASSSPNTNTLAAAWSPAAFSRAAAMAATEARGRHNSAVHYGHRLDNQVALSLFAPEMNLVRAPLWGRAQESCGGEDPLLTARHSAAFVRGMQEGDDPDYLLAAATCKDFPVYVSRTTLCARAAV